jgi:hypothetical protein
VDPTLLRHDGRLWLFANVVSRGRTTEDELFLVSSDLLRGPRVPHPMNAIVSDVRGEGAPVGSSLAVAASLARGDSSQGYGHAITLRRIEELSEVPYREVTVGRIEPRWLAGIRGLTPTTSTRATTARRSQATVAARACWVGAEAPRRWRRYRCDPGA